MKVLNTRDLLTAASFLLSAAAVNAAPAPICSLIRVSAVESLLTRKIEKQEEGNNSFLDSCTYVTVPGEGGPGFFIVARMKIPVPAEGIVSILGRSEGMDEIRPVAGLGDEAVINAGLNELTVRSGSAWYHIITRGTPCPGDKIGASQQVKDKCNSQRNEAAIQAARLILKGI